jgi:hypothetical protein
MLPLDGWAVTGPRLVYTVQVKVAEAFTPPTSVTVMEKLLEPVDPEPNGPLSLMYAVPLDADCTT